MILRATQFFERSSQIVEAGGADARVRLATRLMPRGAVDARAAPGTGRAPGAPVGGRVEVGRPEALGVDAWGRRLFDATGDERTVIGDPQARYFGTELQAAS